MKPMDAIRYAMVVEGLTQAELAEQMGVRAKDDVSALFDKRTRVDTFIRMAATLGYDVVLRKADAELKISV